MELRSITFPPGGYGAGRIIYAFLLADRSVYVGITGTSNRTGTSSPLKRLSTHLAKRGKTHSALHSRQELANRGFRFCYALLETAEAPYAEAIEQRCCTILQSDGIRVLNSPWDRARWPVGSRREQIDGCAAKFSGCVKAALAKRSQ